MKKSYILKFDKVQGDYVIVEQDSQDKNIANNQNVKKHIKKMPFFNFFMPKNNKKEENEKVESESVGYLAEGLVEVNLEQGVVPEKQRMENDVSQPQNPTSVTPNQPSISPGQPSDAPSEPPPRPSQPVNPVPQPNNPPQNNNPSLSVNEGIQLVADLYNNFRVLNMIYQNLRSINQDNEKMFSNYISENIALQGGLLNIYYDLSEQSLPPRMNDVVPSLPAEYLQIVQIAASRVQGMRDINLRLTKLFNVERFNRQFNLIENSLALQNSGLTEIRINN